MQRNPTTISERILDCFPSGSYALNALLQLMEIVESTDVATAAVECTHQPRMKINPDFVAKHAHTPERLMMLVLHELHHVLLGHTRLFPCVTPVDNLVFDAVINALLCRMFPEPAYTSFFADYYDDAEVPSCLLRPSKGWGLKQYSSPPVLLDKRYKNLCAAHRALYSEYGVGYDELYAALRKELGAEEVSLVPLIGDHGKDGATAGEFEVRTPVLYKVVRGIVEQWPQPPNPIRGRSLANLLQNSEVAVVRVPSNRERLSSLLRHVAGARGSYRTHRQLAETNTAAMTPLPTMSRRSLVLRSLGVTSLLHESVVPSARLDPNGGLVHVYLDVSGSIGALKSVLYGAVLECIDLVAPTIHLFSTKVADISVSKFRTGQCRTTGGTDIACVAKHIHEHRVRRAVLITDGYVGSPAGAHLSVLQDTKLGIALIPGNSTREDLANVANCWTQLVGEN